MLFQNLLAKLVLLAKRNRFHTCSFKAERKAANAAEKIKNIHAAKFKKVCRHNPVGLPASAVAYSFHANQASEARAH